MGIKWEGVKVLSSSMTGNIYLGKLDKANIFATDKSEDRTQEVISAVMAHMDFDLKEGAKGTKTGSLAGTLYWIRKGFHVTIEKDDDVDKISEEVEK